MSDIKTLENRKRLLEAELEIFSDKVERKRRELKEVEVDIAAARLQAWYRENPGIELAVGDVLLDGRNNSYTIEEHYLHSYDTEPEVRAVCNEDGEPEEFDIATARRMRETWLAQEAQS